MEYYAMYNSICPGCGEMIVEGDAIHAYRKRWYHAACDHEVSYSPPLWDGTHRGVRADVQQRHERILKAQRMRPYMSVRELAEYLGISKSTVHRVLQEQAREARAGAFRALTQQ